MKYKEYVLSFLLILIASFAFLWLMPEYQKDGQTKATGEEWRRISNGYVE